jgi:hypothetical protein
MEYPSTKWWRFATATSWNVWKLGFGSLTIAQYELKVVPIHDVVAVGVLCRRILQMVESWLGVEEHKQRTLYSVGYIQLPKIRRLCIQTYATTCR